MHIRTIGTNSGGEPLRIVANPAVPIAGLLVAETSAAKNNAAADNDDLVRGTGLR